MDLNIFLKGLDREFRTPGGLKGLKGSGGLKGLNGLNQLILLILLIPQKALED